MSSYFGALIRSSGMRVGNAGTARDAQPAVSDGLSEIHEERDAAAAERPWTVPASRDAGRDFTERPEAVAARGLTAAVPLSPSGPQVIRPEAVSPAAADATASRADGIRPDPQLAASGHPAPAASSPSPSPMDPVRLALQWIAADPESRGTAAVPSRSTVPPAPVPSPASGDAAPPRVVARETGVSEVDEVRPAAPMRQPAARTIAPPPVESFVEPMSVNVHHAARPDGRRDERGDAAEETLEISIGAINLHVEAPAPRTVVQPAPPPQAVARPRVERSGLHRRYLRSF